LTQALQTVGHLQGEIERLQNVNDELQTEMNGIEKERDFYFDKLRDIEMMLQDIEDSGKGFTTGGSPSLLPSLGLILFYLGTELSSKIFEILYATAEGFQPAEEVVPLATDAVMEPSLEAEQEEEDETY
jgi:microtubule-associated protein, RP/EB family